MNSVAIAAAIAILTAAGAAIAIAFASAKGSESIARQPEKAKDIRTVAFLGMVLAESCAIYGLLIALLLFSKI